MNTFELTLEDTYIISQQFFHEKKGKAFQLTYKNRIKMAALSFHIKYNNIQYEEDPGAGLLDFVGRDIRHESKSLTRLSRNEAMKQFIEAIKIFCPEFCGYLRAKEQQAFSDSKLKRKVEELMQQDVLELNAKKEREKEILQKLGFDPNQHENHEKIRSIVNKQTLSQFQEYASLQHPGDISSQKLLIATLQEHHFHQYMLAVFAKFCPQIGLSADISESDEGRTNSCSDKTVEMWCQASVDEFKAGFKDEPESVLKVAPGEVVTIKVNGPHTGDFMTWEFATDEQDIGFGISMASNGGGRVALVPVLRRDSQRQVYCGRLKVGLSAEILLQFDNSYSLWKCKWLYYRVCYSQ